MGKTTTNTTESQQTQRCESRENRREPALRSFDAGGRCG